MQIIEQNKPLRGKEDKLIWKPNKEGIFTVKSARQEQNSNHYDSEQVWRKIWKGLVPPKVEVFLWQLLQERLAVGQVLLDRGIIEPQNALCKFCQEEIETTSHLFFNCSMAWQIWMTICNKWGIAWTSPGTAKEAFIAWTDYKVHPNLQCSWIMLFSATCWSIWLQRNLILFENKNLNISLLGNLIIIRVMHWFKAKFNYATATVREVLFDPKVLSTLPKLKAKKETTWLKPVTGKMKMNVDAAVHVVSNRAGIGAILRDDQGRTRMVFSKEVTCMAVEEVEFLAVWEAFLIFDQSKYATDTITLIIETDSSVAHSWCKDVTKIPWRFNSIAHRFQQLKRMHKGITLCKIPREANKVADSIAKAGMARGHAMLIWL